MRTLAIKYRPKTFDEVVEQKAIKEILTQQLETGTIKNCYLFTGGAGTGKTTCARILANDINKGQGNPIEIDAASNNGVENVREIIENAKFKAIDAEYKVYIIDECHMLSTGAWNAMLKLIEEPPAQTIFIFCTTDPQKIPATILSRVQRYDFQRISHNAVVKRLAEIIKMENSEGLGDHIEMKQEALEYIAKIADGGMRDAITLLDKCISYSPNITIANVVEALGTVDYDTMFDLTEHIINMQQKEAIVLVEEVHRKGVDLKQFMRQYCNFLLDVCKGFLLGGFDYLQIPSTFSDRLEQLNADNYDFICVLLDRIMKMNAAIKWETTPKPLIESTIILLCQQEEA